MTAPAGERLGHEFFARPVVDVARDLVGCSLYRGDVGGMIVETEAYHESEPACHAYNGPTPRAKTLFDEPGIAYVYFSYGVHALFNVVCEQKGVGAAVLIRALEPMDGVEEMKRRRGRDEMRELCSGPGKLTQALSIELSHNASNLASGPIGIYTSAPRKALRVAETARIGITRAEDLPWRFVVEDSRYASR